MQNFNKINIFIIFLIQFSLYSSQNKNEIDRVLPIGNLQKIVSDYTVDWHLYKTIVDKSKSPISSFAASPDGKYLAVGYFEGKVKIWSSEDGKLIKDFLGIEPEYAVAYLAFSQPDGKYLAASEAILWKMKTIISDYKSDKKIQTLAITQPTYSKDGKYLAGALGDTIRIFDTNDYSIINQYYNGSPYISLAFAPNNKYLASVLSSPKTSNIIIRDINTPKIIRTLYSSEYLNSMSFSADSKYIAAAGYESVYLFDVETQKLIHTFSDIDNETNIEEKRPISVEFSPNGKFLAAATGTILKIWDFNTKDLLRVLLEKGGRIRFMHFLPDNSIAYVYSSDEVGQQIKIWKYEGID